MKLCAYLVALFVLSHSTALGQSPAPSDAAKATASAHLRRGSELFQQKAFASALLEFERAYALDPDPRLLYKIGQAKLELQDYHGAAKSYERFIAEGQHPGLAVARTTEQSQPLATLADGVPSVSVTVTLHHLDVSAATFRRLRQLVAADQKGVLDIMLDGASNRPPAQAVSSSETLAAQSEQNRPVLASVVMPAASAVAAAPKTRVTRGIDGSDPYSSGN